MLQPFEDIYDVHRGDEILLGLVRQKNGPTILLEAKNYEWLNRGTLLGVFAEAMEFSSRKNITYFYALQGILLHELSYRIRRGSSR